MVRRPLVLFAGMAVTTLVIAAETGLHVETNRPVTNLAPRTINKWAQKVILIPRFSPPSDSTSEGRNSSYHRQIQQKQTTFLAGDVSRKPIQDIPPLGTYSGTLEPSCLKYLKCQNENQFYFNYMTIYHSDLPEQSAAACGHLCLRQRPNTQLVIAKLNPINQQLVCGCGIPKALISSSGATQVCSQPCPEGRDSCGGPGTVSVYELDRDRKECASPNYFYLGCYSGEVGATAFALGPWERWAGGCRARCGPPPVSEALMRLTSEYDGTTLCECWLTEGELGSSVVQGEGCGWRCSDGEGWCGGNGVTSVYYTTDMTTVSTTEATIESRAAVRERPLSSCIFLVFLSIVLGFIYNDVLE